MTIELPVDEAIKKLLDQKLGLLEAHFDADLISWYGPLLDGTEKWMLERAEELASCPKKKNKLYYMVTTDGGSAITVERQVNILRQHWDEIHFVVPNKAYSAGTILCMSGDFIHMDYYSVLGPIDPQVMNKDGRMVPALGYLDKVNDMLDRAREGKLSNAEFAILKDMDLAELRAYEQAKALTIDLLKKWLVKYKFKNWDLHRTDESKKNKKVTQEEKELRAQEIADRLSSNEWRSHGRPINIEILEELRLQIEDYTDNLDTRALIRGYFNLLTDFVEKYKLQNFIHTRRFI